MAHGLRRLLTAIVAALLLTACTPEAPGASRTPEPGGRLRVAATTSVIGDVVGRVGGEAIALTTLMAPGQDPHSYEPSTTDLTSVAQADVLFVNGWDLEEGLARDLANIVGRQRLVELSQGIEPIAAAEGQGHEHGGADPHVWLDPANVRQWVQTIAGALSDLDPANAAIYQQNAAAYDQQLAALEAYMQETLAPMAPERRKLVTNHDSLAYFARRFQFEVIGTVLPGASTLAEPSAQELVRLVETMRAENVCAIFAETTANVRLAETVAAELSGCDTVHVVQLYTGALGPAGSAADSYVGMMRANVEAIAVALAQ